MPRREHLTFYSPDDITGYIGWDDEADSQSDLEPDEPTPLVPLLEQVSDILRREGLAIPTVFEQQEYRLKVIAGLLKQRGDISRHTGLSATESEARARQEAYEEWITAMEHLWNIEYTIEDLNPFEKVVRFLELSLKMIPPYMVLNQFSKHPQVRKKHGNNYCRHMQTVKQIYEDVLTDFRYQVKVHQIDHEDEVRINEIFEEIWNKKPPLRPESSN